jgi:LPPG:FO 2-phospho-L-lactate transferase
LTDLFLSLNVVALAGGVGGARLANGLANILSPEHLTIIVNTGDDFEHLGLTICPDLDTVTYTLAGLANPQTGWGIRDDTFTTLDWLTRLGGPTWFRLGDGDLATHLLRTQLLRAGMRLTEVTGRLCQALGVKHAILPMCDQPCRTVVQTEWGEMDFQTYFVFHACRPGVKGFRWNGLETATPSPEVLAVLQAADLVVFCPSNPFVSLDPIMGGKVVKGPAAKMFAELGIPPSALAVAGHYRDLLDGFVLDEVDRDLIPQVKALNITPIAMPTLMPGLGERTAVALQVVELGARLLQGRST